MSSALRILIVIGVMAALTAAAAAVTVSGVDGETDYSESPKFDVDKQVLKFGDSEYKWTDLIEVNLRPLQPQPEKDCKIFLRNGNVIFGEIKGASVEGAGLLIKVKSRFLGGETKNLSADSIAGIQNLNQKAYLQLALATLQRKAKSAPFGRVDFHGAPMTESELQELFNKKPEKFAMEAKEVLAATSGKFERFMKNKDRWEYDFYYGVKSGETEAYGLIDKINDDLDVILVREKSKKEVKGNLTDIVGLGFKSVNLPQGFDGKPYVKILGVKGEIVTGQIMSEKDGVIVVKTDLEGITLKVAVDDIAEMIFFNGSFIFLSDLAKDKTRVKSIEYGDLCLPGTTTSESFPWQHDRSTMQKRPPLKLNDKIYRKGIGMHSHSELTFRIDGKYKRFKALAGIDNRVPKPGNVTVEIYGDNKILVKKTTVKSGDKPLNIDIDIKGVKELKIVVDFGEGGYHNDHCDIANAILIK